MLPAGYTLNLQKSAMENYVFIDGGLLMGVNGHALFWY
jgi:hypothetical protein